MNPADREAANSAADYFATHLSGLPVIAIMRGLDPDTAVGQARKAWADGVPLVEVTLQDGGGYDALAAVLDAAPPGCEVGAGTVTTPEQLERARTLGARFGIAPGLDAATVVASHRLHMPFLPGVATASEVQAAQSLGVTTVKAFPADLLTPSWIRAMKGPFPAINFIATGGLDATNAPAMLEAGATGVAASTRPDRESLAAICAALR